MNPSGVPVKVGIYMSTYNRLAFQLAPVELALYYGVTATTQEFALDPFSVPSALIRISTKGS